MDYRNLGPSNAWDLTLISHDQYVLLDAASLSPWMVLPGFSLESVSFDWMHNVYLGTGRDLFASALLTLVEKGVYSYVGSNDLDELLSHAESRLRASCSQHGFLGLFTLKVASSVWRPFQPILFWGTMATISWLQTIARKDIPKYHSFLIGP